MRISSGGTAFFPCLALYLGCSVVLLLTYTGQIGEANAYMGMQPWDMSVAGYFGFAIGLPVVAWIVSMTKGRPSDFFRVFYGTIVVTSFLVLHPVSGRFSAPEIFTGIVFLFLPFVMIEALDAILPTIKIRGVIGASWLELLIVLVLLFVMLNAAARPPASAGFALDVSYDRRLEGRDIYGAGSWLAYGLSMAMNGLAPYLAFRAGLGSRIFIFGVALTAVGFFYWLLGVKAPLVFVIVSALLGVFVRKGNLSNVGRYFLAAVLGFGLVVLVEWLFFDGYSLIADFFFRRVFAVQAEIQGYYLKFLLNEKTVSWSWLYGSFDRNFAATFHIGEHFMGNEASNANTNAFSHQFAAKGFIGYICALVLVPFILVIFDRLYNSSRNPSYLFLGFLYGVLVIEQAYTVAMVSSGVALLLVLTLLEAECDADKALTV
ncbi:MAG: hypothetical protein Q8N06_00565 [Hydrogenophaga sp.]|nr:hypothetical protein [Hydrogenophaga sp.]